MLLEFSLGKLACEVILHAFKNITSFFVLCSLSLLGDRVRVKVRVIVRLRVRACLVVFFAYHFW